MTRTTQIGSTAVRSAPMPHSQQVAQAELDFHECIARYGHNSAEAHIAEMLWRRARNRRL